MNRGIDHLVLCVHDLERARAFYAALGFRLTPTALHPFGTKNSLVQLQGNFIELLGIADASKISPAETGHFSFAHHNLKFLEAGEGCSMLVFEGSDARADQAEFKLKQLDTYSPFDFSRKAKLPDGEVVTVGFSLAFVSHPEMTRSVFFTCQQHAPEHFWKPDYQVHDNQAQVISNLVMVADDPSRLADFYRALQGTDAVDQTGNALTVATARGNVQVMTSQGYERKYGAGSAPDLDAGPRFAAMVIETTDLTAVIRSAGESGIVVEHAPGAVRVPAQQAFGTLVEFVEG